jgi:Leucine-rich repeat (LRR) protein
VVFLNGNRLTGISLRSLPKLKTLNAEGNQMATLGVSKNKQLKAQHHRKQAQRDRREEQQ